MFLTTLLTAFAFAAETAPTAELNSENEKLMGELKTVKAELEALKKNNTNNENQYKQLILGAETLLNDQLSVQERIKGVNLLFELNTPKVLRFYRAGVLYAPPAVKRAAIKSALAHVKHTEVLEIGKMCLANSIFTAETQTACIDLLTKNNSIDAAKALYKAASNKDLKASIRKVALAALKSDFSEWLAKQTPPKAISSTGGRLLATAAFSAAGSSVLRGIGELGVSDAAIGVGTWSGVFIGGGTGWLYTQNKPVSLGQGAMAATTVGWGLIQTEMLKSLLGYDEKDAGWLRTLASGGATYYAMQQMNKETSAVDAIELNVAGYLGSRLALDIGGLFEEREDYVFEDPEDFEQSESDESAYDKRIGGYLLAGSTIGLLGGHWLKDKWNLTSNSALFSGVAAIEGAVLGSMLSNAFDFSHAEEATSISAHSAAIIGQLIDTWAPVGIDHSLSMAYMSATGHFLGAGAPLLFGVSEESKAPEITSSIMGLSGAIAGPWIANKRKLNTNDAALLGVGTGFSTWNAWALASMMESTTFAGDANRATGFGLTLQGLGQLASIGMAAQLDINKDQSLFVGSMGVWGAYYGFTLPYALGNADNLTDNQKLGLTLAISDAAMLGAGYAISPMGFMKAKEGAVPQLMGIGGAALGALGAYMATTNEQTVSLSSMTGSLIGIGAGLWLNNRIQASTTSAWLPENQFDLNGWSGHVGPTLMPDGSTGISMQINKFGF